MCCCELSNVNGQPGYKWQPSDAPTTRPIDAPELEDGDVLLFDEPGRCQKKPGGGLDSHCHHFRMVKWYSRCVLLVKNGGGTKRIVLGCAVGMFLLLELSVMSSNDRYWLMQSLYSTHTDAAREATEKEAQRWKVAAAEKRIKCRKDRRTGGVTVSIV